MTKPSQVRPVSASPRVRICVYGNSGAGKTRLIGSCGKRTLIIRPAVEHVDAILGSGAEEWVVADWTEMNVDVLEYLRHEAHKDFDWVWLDSVSAWQDVGLDDVFQAAVDRKPSRAEFGVDRPEYGINAGRIGMWVRHVVGGGNFHFGITAWPRELPPTEDLTVDEKLMPWIQVKNMPQKICGYMNMVGYLQVKDHKKGPNKGKQYNVLNFKETEDYFAKDQFYAFGEKGKLVDPTIPKIMEAIEARQPPKPKKSTTATKSKNRTVNSKRRRAAAARTKG